MTKKTIKVCMAGFGNVGVRFTRLLLEKERELREEMDMDISIPEDAYLMTVEHTYPDFAITMHAYVCKLAQPKFIMKEHVAAKWLPPADLSSLDWAAADMPIVERLQQEEIE